MSARRMSDAQFEAVLTVTRALDALPVAKRWDVLAYVAVRLLRQVRRQR